MNVEAGGASSYSNEPRQSQVSTIRIRITFGAFLVVAFIIGLLLQYEFMEWIAKWAIDRDGQGCNGSLACVGHQGAYRVSFAAFLFFLAHWLMSTSWNCCLTAGQQIAFNQPVLMWVRALIFAALIFISFVIPNVFFTYYAWFCVVISCLYLIAQCLILLHFAFEWNESWVSRDDKKFMYGLLICTIALFIGGLVAIGFLFHWFGNDSSCSAGQGVLIVTLVLGVVYTFLSVVTGGSLLPSAVVFGYTVWMAYSALSSGNPPGICNQLSSSSDTQMIIGSVITGVALGVAATNAGTSRDAFSMSSGNSESTEEEQEAKQFSFFHVMMMMSSCYLSMLLTSWAITGSEGISLNADSGKASMGVKIASEMLCIVLYVWMLIAPKVCGDREFA